MAIRKSCGSSPLPNPLLLTLFSHTFLFFPVWSYSGNLDAFVYGGCSHQKHTPGSPYQSNLNSLLTSLVNSATFSAYNNFTVAGASPPDVVYGLYQCRGDLSMPDCATCVARAVTQMGTLCSGTCGGAIQLEGCYVKYDNATFLGVEDKTVVLKKCGPSVGYEPGPMGRRDAVLASLGGDPGLYRVGGSGEVEGVAQCLGDLSMGECQDCISEAVGLLKSDCGTAVYGDMYLTKCYAKYSTGGGSADYQPHNGKSNDEEDDDGEKTFAIMIGLLAGVALLVIFLTFLRKAFKRDDDGK
ncbi:plasmodesmata-located protein 7-like [Punica granatum]|uniref:Plasmodesmata-located protein 7-like n=1 Tax=Punica granatum TaxID=22663 RepID=A0A6P8D645_PUNGR|nr:plasmodesmata-located protein 7-like [Punica granatum]